MIFCHLSRSVASCVAPAMSSLVHYSNPWTRSLHQSVLHTVLLDDVAKEPHLPLGHTLSQHQNRPNLLQHPFVNFLSITIINNHNNSSHAVTNWYNCSHMINADFLSPTTLHQTHKQGQSNQRGNKIRHLWLTTFYPSEVIKRKWLLSERDPLQGLCVGNLIRTQNLYTARDESFRPRIDSHMCHRGNPNFDTVPVHVSNQ